MEQVNHLSPLVNDLDKDLEFIKTSIAKDGVAYSLFAVRGKSELPLESFIITDSDGGISELDDILFADALTYLDIISGTLNK